MPLIYTTIGVISGNKSTVLVTGESGTGKELVSRTIHLKSPWADQPFLAINCGAMSETLLDSQLFVHKRGSISHRDAFHPSRPVLVEKSSCTVFYSELRLALPHLNDRRSHCAQKFLRHPKKPTAKKRVDRKKERGEGE